MNKEETNPIVRELDKTKFSCPLCHASYIVRANTIRGFVPYIPPQVVDVLKDDDGKMIGLKWSDGVITGMLGRGDDE